MIKPIIPVILALAATVTAQAQTFGATTPVWKQRSMYRNIIVLEGNGHRCLTFGARSDRQSCINLSNPGKLVFSYTQKIFDALQYLPKIDRVMVIGIGGGSLPKAIRAEYPEAHVDAVELDQEVINVAFRHFQFKPDEKLNVFAEDGRVFIRKKAHQKTTYDAIILDAFDKDYIPEHMSTREFFGQIKSLINKNGVLLANTFKETNFAKYEEATYQSVFGQIYESVVPSGNRIIIAGQHARELASRLPDTYPVQASKTEVMTDKFSPANALLIH